MVNNRPRPPELSLAKASAKLAASRCVAVLTGAGASAESGIRTFRDTMEGLWQEFDPARLASPEGFARDPATVTRWYDTRRLGCLAAEPNPSHLALAQLERAMVAKGGEFIIFTQNVDRLHQRAGSRHVVELHGNILEWRCTRTGRVVELEPQAQTEFPPPSPFSKDGVLRPHVVWFGEELPRAALQKALEVCPRVDYFLTIGTSSTVYPAAGLIELVDRGDCTTVEVNRESTGASGRVDFALVGSAGDIVPRLVAQAYPTSAA